MNRGNIPNDVRNFVLSSIPSVSFLEALLQLRAGGLRDWDAEQLAKKVYVNAEAAAALLAQLRASGFTEAVEGDLARYRYRPCSEELQSMADRLAQVYSRHLIEISRLIHSKQRGAR